MPVNSKAKVVSNILDLKFLEQKSTREGFGTDAFRAERAHDMIFRKMSAEEKIRLAGRFYHFTRALQRLNTHGAGKTSR